MIPPQRPSHWLSVVLVCLLLAANGPATVLAQSEPSEGQDRVYLPFVQQPAQLSSSEQTLESDDGPAVTEVEIPPAAVGQVMAANRIAYLPAYVTDNRLERPIYTAAAGLPRLSPALRAASGRRQVVVRLLEPSVGEMVAFQVGAASVDRQQAQLATLQTAQAALISEVQSLDASAVVLGTVQKALNAVILEVDTAALPELAANPAVLSVRPVVDYEQALTETVPYIGATAVQQAGFDGRGVRVAVVDSGIDYTHKHFGGPGTVAAYELAYGKVITDPRNTARDGLFPTPKVLEGVDFVGESWPDGDLAPDDDPIDFEGHGTHVADIIGGNGGVAPGVELFAVKVCSSIDTACSGVALIQAMDYVLDPNGDGDLSDHMDVVNMSLGANYGTAFDDDLSYAVDVASALGVLTIASAGNGADKPYVAGTPAAAPSALSVAQTNVPSAVQPVMEILQPAAITGQYAAVFQPWSVAPSGVIEAPVQYGDGAGGNLLGCDAFAPGSLTGKIVLVDRGACTISLKISNIADGGGLAGVVGLMAPGDPTEFGLGDGDPSIPGYNISQADARRIKQALAAGETVIARFDPSTGIPVVGHMVGSSSRGPSMGANLIKPEIGAPGASVSAVVGSGDGVEPFGGTSGAAPMVSGAAALLIEAFPERVPAEIKAMLMNTAETNILNTPVLFGGDLAPITRIGAGEVRVDRALQASAIAMSATSPTAALSFQFHDITRTRTVEARMVQVHNFSDRAIRYIIQNSYRFADDAESGAVVIEAPGSVLVPAGGDATFKVKAIVNGEALLNWSLNSGSLGANGRELSALEYDGYLLLSEEGRPENNLHLPWHILPRKAADVNLREIKGRVKVNNRGVGTTLVESYSLIGRSRNLRNGHAGQLEPRPDFRYLGYATFPVPADFCSEEPSFILAIAINTFERQTHADAPAQFEVDLDTNHDGQVDYAVFNFDLSLSGSLSDGRNLTHVLDVASGQTSAFFFTEHDTNSANTLLLLCGEQIGMDADNFGQPINATAFAIDWFNHGADADFGIRDVIEKLVITPMGERYLGVFAEGGVGATLLPGRTFDFLSVIELGATPANRGELGLLLFYRAGAPDGREAGVVLVKQ